MKFEKFVTMSTFQAFLMFVCAIMIVSCQKKNIHQNGYFSHYSLNIQQRSPASISPTPIQIGQFDQTQDSKQIYIYCSQNSLKVRQCYEHHFNQILSDFINTYGALEPEKLISLKEKNRFDIVQSEVQKIQSDILEKLNLKLKSIVSKREEFCGVNSKINPEKCMSQYLERDSLAILNAYQYENKRMNGHEYIYLKNIIHNDLKAKLEVSSEALKKKLQL